MMNKNRFTGILLIIGLIQISCSYTPTESNYVDVDQESRITPNYTLLDQEGDTLDATPGGSFTYDFRTDSIRIYRVIVYMNNQLISESNGASGTFWIKGRNYETGVYDLDVVVSSSTGTQSLADQSGVESYQTTKKWYVAIDNDPATPVQIKRTYKDDQTGGLVIEWERYDRINFYRYFVKSTNSGSYYINDQFQTSLLLPDYYGLESELIVTVEVVDNSSYARSDTVKLPNTASSLLSIQQDENNSTKISWSKSPYSYNFNSYEILYDNGFIHRLSVSEIIDTILVIPNSPTSDLNRFQIKIRTNSGDEKLVYDETFDILDLKFYTLEEHEDISQVQYNNGIYFIYLYNSREKYNYLKAIDANDRSVLKSIRLERGSYTQYLKDYIITSEYGSGLIIMDYDNTLEPEFIDFGYGDYSMNVSVTGVKNYIYVILKNGYEDNYSTFKEFYFDLETKNEVTVESVFTEGFRIVGDNIIDVSTGVTKYTIDSEYRNHKIIYNIDASKAATVSYIPAAGQANNPDYKTRFSAFSLPDFNVLSETNFDGNHHLLHVNEDLTRFLFYFGYLIDSGGYYGYLLVLDEYGNEISRTNVAHGTYFYQNGKAINEFGYMIDVEM